jgi:hypothetical protein
VALAVLRGGDVHARAECDIYSRRHTRMFDILDEMGKISPLTLYALQVAFKVHGTVQGRSTS